VDVLAGHPPVMLAAGPVASGGTTLRLGIGGAQHPAGSLAWRQRTAVWRLITHRTDARRFLREPARTPTDSERDAARRSARPRTSEPGPRSTGRSAHRRFATRRRRYSFPRTQSGRSRSRPTRTARSGGRSFRRDRHPTRLGAARLPAPPAFPGADGASARRARRTWRRQWVAGGHDHGHHVRPIPTFSTGQRCQRSLPSDERHTVNSPSPADVGARVATKIVPSRACAGESAMETTSVPPKSAPAARHVPPASSDASSPPPGEAARRSCAAWPLLLPTPIAFAKPVGPPGPLTQLVRAGTRPAPCARGAAAPPGPALAEPTTCRRVRRARK